MLDVQEADVSKTVQRRRTRSDIANDETHESDRETRNKRLSSEKPLRDTSSETVSELWLLRLSG